MQRQGDGQQSERAGESTTNVAPVVVTDGTVE
jgi:hypothetical protein